MERVNWTDALHIVSLSQAKSDRCPVEYTPGYWPCRINQIRHPGLLSVEIFAHAIRPEYRSNRPVEPQDFYPEYLALFGKVELARGSLPVSHGKFPDRNICIGTLSYNLTAAKLVLENRIGVLKEVFKEDLDLMAPLIEKAAGVPLVHAR